MQFSLIIEVVKIVLEFLIVVLGWFFVRRLEQIKSEVGRHSDFNQKWADLFFDASNAFMNSVEQIETYAHFMTLDKDGKNQSAAEWRKEMDKAIPVLMENRFRVQRLSLLAPLKGSDADKAAQDLWVCTSKLFIPEPLEIAELRNRIDTFNRAAREAHSEMIASRKNLS